ncbi:MAG: hypothetical protein ACEQSQ_00225 [Candidatus Paceibacteria bacterium]
MQEISSLPVYTGVIPNKQTQNDYDFANNVFGFINYSGNTLIPYFNDTITDLNILSGQINTKASEVATNTQTVSEKTALVQSITASLPAGTVLDSAVSERNTWSSSKIKTLLDNITAIITSSDTSLDSFQEIVAYIKQNKTVLDTLAISNIAGLVSALAGKLGVNDTAASAVTLTIPAIGYKHLGSWGNDGITAGNGNVLVNSAYRAERCMDLSNHQWGNNSGSGYIRLSTGLIMQWGRAMYPDTNWLQTLFPVSFPTGCSFVGITVENGGPTDGTVLNPNAQPTNTGFTHFTYTNPTGRYFRWLAIGY